MLKKLKDLLLQAGLSETECLVYLELLKEPVENKWNLIIRTGLNKSKVYRSCERLQQLKMIEKTNYGICASSLDNLLDYLNKKQEDYLNISKKIKAFMPFMKVPTEAVASFDIAHNQEQILDLYDMMSNVKYDTCLDFGDLENYVDVLGGLEPVFKFRANRFKQNAKNNAICTTIGPYTSCMARKEDLKRFKSEINSLPIKFDGKWMIFSDTNDYVMFNDFTDMDNPNAVVINSKLIADTQRMFFEQFSKNIANFS